MEENIRPSVERSDETEAAIIIPASELTGQARLLCAHPQMLSVVPGRQVQASGPEFENLTARGVIRRNAVRRVEA